MRYFVPPELPLAPVPLALPVPVPLVPLEPVPLALPVPLVPAPEDGLVVADEVLPVPLVPEAPVAPVGPAAPRLEFHASNSCCETRPSLSVSAELGTPAALASSLESWPSEFLSYVRNWSDEPDIALLVEPVPELRLGEVVLPVALLPVPLVPLVSLVVLLPVLPVVALLPVPLVEPALVPPLPLVLLPLVWASASAGASASATLMISVFFVISRSPV